MRILIDTNIFIYREGDKIIKEDIQTFSKILSSKKILPFLHPESITDINRDRDEKRKKSTLSKIKCYSLLENSPKFQLSIDFSKKVKWKEGGKDNDRVDNELLYAVYTDCVEFLVTEDRGIHKKAEIFKISEKVLKVSEFIQKILELYPEEKKILTPPAIKFKSLNSSYLSQKFFKSLKEEYAGFDKWFKKRCLNGEKAYIHEDGKGEIQAFLMLKKENPGEESELCKPPLPKRSRIKIRTLKVSNNGKKIGELFLKLSISKAMGENIDEIYVTHFEEKNDPLVNLLLKFGFFKIPNKIIHENGKAESIFIKKIVPPKFGEFSQKMINHFYFPSFYDGKKCTKYIVPIKPDYHGKLFTDFKKRQTTLNEHMGEFIVEGNTIEKAYLCGAPFKNINKGDLLLFYRSQDTMGITSVGIVEEAFNDLPPEKILHLTSNRTVYKEKEILKNKPALTILFRHCFHFPKEVHLSKLHEENIIKGNFLTMRKIGNKEYSEIKRFSGINPKYTRQ
ncbi:MAG: hypothetical protein KC516_01645 [Nanoarchaeota archaeon]|nr:hypothetical protein [Nanoarchaeota archaeon]